MTDTTTRLALPLLVPGQAQKEMFHNEALALIDLALQASVVAVGVDVPPAQPAAGACWIVGSAPTGSWSGHPGALAGWTEGGWRFLAPVEGMAVWDRTTGTPARWSAGGWATGSLSAARLTIGGAQVVGPRRPAIPTPTGGAAVDAEARSAVAAILDALRGHGLIAS